MGTVSQPVGGHSPAAERKLGKVPHEEKTSIVYVFLAVGCVYLRPELSRHCQTNLRQDYSETIRDIRLRPIKPILVSTSNTFYPSLFQFSTYTVLLTDLLK
jgi:hypothetical protein